MVGIDVSAALAPALAAGGGEPRSCRHRPERLAVGTWRARASRSSASGPCRSAPSRARRGSRELDAPRAAVVGRARRQLRKPSLRRSRSTSPSRSTMSAITGRRSSRLRHDKPRSPKRAQRTVAAVGPRRVVDAHPRNWTTGWNDAESSATSRRSGPRGAELAESWCATSGASHQGWSASRAKRSRRTPRGRREARTIARDGLRRQRRVHRLLCAGSASGSS